MIFKYVFPKYANFIIFIIIGVKSLNIKKTFQEDALAILGEVNWIRHILLKNTLGILVVVNS